MDTDSLLNLRKFLAPEIVYGQGAISLSGRHANNFGASKVFIVTDPGVRKAGWTSAVEASLKKSDIHYVVFDGVTPNPKDHEVMEGADLIPNPGPPLIFIPTTAGSSADVSQFAIIADTTRNVKITIISKMVIPDIALIDPKTTTSMSSELTAATGMDALCHAFEAFVSNASSPLTDMAALSSVQIISDNFLKAYENPDNITYRDKMMTASLMAGMAFSNASLGLVHAMAHSLGGAFDLPHGECNALLLEKVVLFNYSACPEKYNQLAKAMHVNIDKYEFSERGAVISDQISSLRKSLDINQRLVDLGVQSADIPKLSEFAFQDPCLATNPRETNKQDIERLYMQIYE